jgi:hypothetical protein
MPCCNVLSLNVSPHLCGLSQKKLSKGLEWSISSGAVNVIIRNNTIRIIKKQYITLTDGWYAHIRPDKYCLTFSLLDKRLFWTQYAPGSDYVCTHDYIYFIYYVYHIYNHDYIIICNHDYIIYIIMRLCVFDVHVITHTHKVFKMLRKFSGVSAFTPIQGKYSIPMYVRRNFSK